jgi:hypothetical protein
MKIIATQVVTAANADLLGADEIGRADGEEVGRDVIVTVMVTVLEVVTVVVGSCSMSV